MDWNRLERIKKRFPRYTLLREDMADIEWLISTVERLGGVARLEELESEIEKDRDYQRRHREWALFQAKRSRNLLRYEVEKYTNSYLASLELGRRAEARVKELEARLQNLQECYGGGHVIY